MQRHPKGARGLVVLSLALVSASAFGQYAERPRRVGALGSNVALDASGRSVKNDRVRAVHTTDPELAGGTAHFIKKDPYLAYQLGRNLHFREFRKRDGFGGAKLDMYATLGGPMPDGTTAKVTLQNATGCLNCHNIPNGNPGGGNTLDKDSGFGRQAPHYFGAGLSEMIGLQTRQELLDQLDTNTDGWVSATEAAAAPSSVDVSPTPGAPALDFGDPRLDGGLTGSPSLNNIAVVWYVDANGMHVPGATSVDGVTTFGYNFELIIWGWGQGLGCGALNPTNRAFLWDPWAAHSGLEAYDPTTNVDLDGDGISGPSLAGAIQFPATHKSPDKGNNVHVNGYSKDDPDGDEYWCEISEGDLDLGEWFMLHLPAPSFRGTPAQYAAGVAQLDALGCTSCHVADWEIKAADASHSGDRRVFDYTVTWDDVDQRLEGKLTDLSTLNGELHEPNHGSFLVEGIFGDFRHHDLGPDFHEFGYDGVVNTQFRTAPLWGVGSGFPWGHDGASLTLHDVIMRHGGAAQASKDAYANAGTVVQEDVQAFLEKLVLYDYETLPTDMDGSGTIETNFAVQGVDTGEERFNAEWLLKVPLEIQGMVMNAEGQMILSNAGVNIPDAYGELLPYRKDTDSDGWPDVWDVAPTHTGYKDGVN